MKKFINNPENFIEEMLAGLYVAHPNYIECVDGQPHCLVSKQKVTGKVALASGGGSGHLPLFLGYVGEGMLDGCAVGGVFQSPSAEEILAVTKHIDQGSGSLYIYGNYNGDIFNFTMAAEMAEMEENIAIQQVIVGDDVASGKRVEEGERNLRRGVAGIFFVYKVAGAAAAQMKSLQEVQKIALRASQQVATMGVALSPCTIPRLGYPSFTIAEDEMEIGMGIHGEQGIRRGKLITADELVKELLVPIIEDLQLQPKDEVAVLINGLGATPLEEQYLVNRKVNLLLTEYKIHVIDTYVGEYATSLEMAGLSISILKLDSELKHCLHTQANTPFFKQFKKGE